MKRLLFAIVAATATGCLDEAGDGFDTPSDYAAGLSATSAQSILDLVNYPGTDLHALDVTARLDTRAAGNIITARNGADGIAPSSDDVVFTSLDEIDALPQVGDATFAKLAAFATAHPAPAGEIVKQVVFRGWESESVVWAVNHATPVELDAIIEARAASYLVAGRPFTSVTQMGSVQFVGAATLGQLRTASTQWWTAMHGGTLGGTFDSVTFDGEAARVALEIANQATLAQLLSHGMTSPAASAIIGKRSFATLAQVANVSGVGTSTMAALKAYATSNTWGTPGSTIASFTAAVTPQLGTLLFLSESDRPLDVVAFPGAGDLAPTYASVMALTHALAGSTGVQRGVENFYSRLEADDDAAAAVRAAVEAQLTDVIYVNVYKPAGSAEHALVDVYLVGRTASGDLVGLHTISVET